MGNEYPNAYNRTPVYLNHNKPIIITTTKMEYYKDDIIEGNVALQNQIPIVLSDIYLILYLLESWSYQGQTEIIEGDYNTQPLLCIKVGINKILGIDSDLVNLPAGSFNFPFN